MLIFDSSLSKGFTRNQKILWGCSFGCHNLSNFTCLTMTFHNFHHTNGECMERLSQEIPLKVFSLFYFFPWIEQRTGGGGREKTIQVVWPFFLFAGVLFFFAAYKTSPKAKQSASLQLVKVANIAVFMFHLDSIFWPLCGDKIAPPSFPLFFSS